MSSIAEKLQRKSQGQSTTKQVRLKLVHIDFWSAVKFSFLIALSLGIALIVSTLLLWIVLNATGVFGELDELLHELLAEKGFSLATEFSFNRVAMFSSVVAILDIVVGTVLGVIASVLYNFSVRITGGLLVGFTNN